MTCSRVSSGVTTARSFLAAPFLNAFFSGRKLTMEEALELKDLIDQHTWED